MPDIQERLRQALRQPVRAGAAAHVAGVTTLDNLAPLGGHWFQTNDGPGYVIESVYEAGHEHGNIPLYRALELSTPHLGAQCRDGRIGMVAPADLLYLDTETTGLGGAGCMVFLAGIARFDGSVLRLRQYLLPAPAYEGGLLGGVAGDIARAGALVTYNGKSFDVPVLETRYILSRQRPALRDLPHIDLLHPNRRIFRGMVDSHRLTELEVQLLGFEREADCPSWEVPGRYFAFQRSGDPTHIAPVLRHNAWDILSLVALTVQVSDICSGTGDPLQLARAAEYAGDLETAARRYEEAAFASGRADRVDHLERAAAAWKQLERWDDAVRVWQAIIAEPRSRRLLPFVELAKHAEHRSRDLAAAHAHTEEALALIRGGRMRPGRSGSPTGLAELEHRLARLERRLSR